jgi:hypothetical protein
MRLPSLDPHPAPASRFGPPCDLSLPRPIECHDEAEMTIPFLTCGPSESYGQRYQMRVVACSVPGKLVRTVLAIFISPITP